jgi:hypothetical protein
MEDSTLTLREGVRQWSERGKEVEPGDSECNRDISTDSGERLNGPRMGVRLAQLQHFPFFHQDALQHS